MKSNWPIGVVELATCLGMRGFAVLLMALAWLGFTGAALAAEMTCRSDAGFANKLNAVLERGQLAYLGTGSVRPAGDLPAPPQPFNLDPETGEIIPSKRPGPIPADYLFSGTLSGPGGGFEVEDHPITLSIGCAGLICTQFPGVDGAPLEALFILVEDEQGLKLDAGPCKGYSYSLTAAQTAALGACVTKGQCEALEWAAFCDRQSYVPMQPCIRAGLLVRDPKTGRFTPKQR